MLIHSKQLANKIILIAALLVGGLSAKEIPITQEVELTVPVGQFSVIEFPFKIVSKNVTSFMAAKTLKGKKPQVASMDDALANPIGKGKKSKKRRNKKNKGKKTSSAKKDKNIVIKQNVNSFTFFPKKEGVFKMVVWGYKHPMLLTIRADKKDGFALYQFVRPLSDSKEVFLTEQGSHEKVINKIMNILLFTIRIYR